ncbi:MAG TPA: XRE family transcriptional regulator [Nitrososphaera sp.]|jgi:Zn-dependent peptidase ImmA (M78 family)/DNA-binding XRE family transcriptional regulator
MQKSITVAVRPEVLKWLRESAGWKVEEASKRLGITVEAFLEVESGKRNPSLKQLKILSAAYKRPLASFLLSKPKAEKPLPKDYRFLPNREGIFDRKTILAVRKSRSLQDIGKELSLNIRYDTEPKVERVGLSADPNDIAAKHRQIFSLDWEKQRKFKDAYKMFGYLRDLLEDMNILVFQFSMPIEDARGFALCDEAPAVIVVNSKDSIEARLFTLMHEFGHVLLGETVIDIPEGSFGTRNEIERWCNAFASSFLLPAEIAENLFREKRSVLTDTETLNTLSRKYKVSKAALLVKMRDLNYISKQEFEGVLDRYVLKVGTKKIKTEKRPISSSPDKRCVSEVGNKFVSLVANNFDKKFITYTDALSYLSIKSRNLDKVLAKAKK